MRFLTKTKLELNFGLPVLEGRFGFQLVKFEPQML